MERTKDMPAQPTPLRWRKVGGGTFRMGNGRIIKQNQVFEAPAEDIPEGFRDVVVPVDGLPEEKPLEVQEATFSVEAGAPGWFNVVGQNGKIVNEKQLRAADAQKLIEELMV